MQVKLMFFFEKLHFYLHKVTKLMNFDQKVSSKGSLARQRWRIVNTDVPIELVRSLQDVDV